MQGPETFKKQKETFENQVDQNKKTLANLQQNYKQASQHPQLKTLMEQMEKLRAELTDQKNVVEQRDRLHAQTEEYQTILQNQKKVVDQINDVVAKHGLTSPLDLDQKMGVLHHKNQQNELQINQLNALYQAAQEEMNDMKKTLADSVIDPAKAVAAKYRPGDVVKVKKLGLAIVQFYGILDEPSMPESDRGHTYVGVELDAPVGDTNGVIGNKKIFKKQLKPKHGMFLPESDIKRIIPAGWFLHQLNAMVEENTRLKSLQNANSHQE